MKQIKLTDIEETEEKLRIAIIEEMMPSGKEVRIHDWIYVTGIVHCAWMRLKKEMEESK